jgi:hypothetical protein
MLFGDPRWSEQRNLALERRFIHRCACRAIFGSSGENLKAPRMTKQFTEIPRPYVELGGRESNGMTTILTNEVFN